MLTSSNQAAIYEYALSNPNKNILVEAVAGSGKTTTIFNLNKLIEDKNRLSKNLYLVFNRRNQEEAAEKFSGQNIQVYTFNGFGSMLVRDIRGRISSRNKLKFNSYKTYNLAKEIAEKLGTKKFNLRNISKLIGLLKNHCVFNTTDFDSMLPLLLEKFNIELTGDDETVLRETWSESLTSELFDFDDQLFLPVLHDVPFPKFTNVFVDECQDLNPIKIKIVEKLKYAGARIIAVGDRGQAIYGFAGADTESIDTLTKVLDPEFLPLNVNYRCSRAVISMAKRIVPQIEAHAQAGEGKVINISEKELGKLKAGDFVLCRVNAPLVKLCFKLLRDNIPARILGKDVGDKLIETVEKIGSINFEKLNENKEREITNALAKKRKIDDIEDRYDTLEALFENHKSIDTLVEWIENVFTDSVDAKRVVVLSSIHKSKGLEAHTVVLLYPDLLPHPKAKEQWELVQEKNLEYVAYTRAKDTLILCERN